MSLNIQDITNIHDHRAPVTDTDHCAIPLFHGTRSYALEASDKDRERFYAACDRVMTFARVLANGNTLDQEALLTYQRQKDGKFLSVPVFLYKKTTYEYGDLYLTSCYTDALIYAACAGGELGEYAHAQCIGFEAFGVDLTEEVRLASSVIMEEYEKYRHSEKLILVYDGVAFQDLQDRNGNPFLVLCDDKEMEKRSHAWAINNLYDSKVSDNGVCCHHLRLPHPATYTATVIHEKDFVAGIALFTDIQDIDRYLKRHPLL
ncbi:MAG: hypothetical protein E7527_04430 [Ruminococcaceae bacterium]|nr:hypothetical protein [Oscillospiraceae bacterium]